LFVVNEIGCFDHSNFELLQSLCNFLEPFKACIESLESSKYVTLRSAVLLKMKLKQHLQVRINELPIITKLKETAMSYFNKKWIITTVHKVVTF